ncbi:Sucrose synthase 2 [Glycine max]|nr:Sucrose synthase 2 [Glycine max]
MHQHHPVSFHDSAFSTLAFHLYHTGNQDGFQPNLETHLLPLLSMKTEDTFLEFNSRDLLFCLKDVIFLPSFVAIPLQEELVDGKINDNFVLELDFEPFNATFPCPFHSASIGNGVQFLNRHLSPIMFRTKDSLQPLLDSLQAHKYKGHTLMINDRVQTFSNLQSALAMTKDYLSKLASDTLYSEFEYVLQGMDFERGWGDTIEQVLEMMHLFLDFLQAPDHYALETFLGREPMVFNVAILSPHGYFGQANVLGLPDIGGQVVYILDQVCALENEMLLQIKKQGLDFTPRILIFTRLIANAKGTTCNQRLERVSGTDHTHILRVQFRSELGTLSKWNSRFLVWTYLETYVEAVASEIVAELQGHPTSIIGNYSDGNLVASLLAYKMGNRLIALHSSIEKLLFDPEQTNECVGSLKDKSKPVIFSMARLDKVKNIIGLVECFGKNNILRELVNLVVVAGYIDVKKSNERAEIAEIEKMHELMKNII